MTKVSSYGCRLTASVGTPHITFKKIHQSRYFHWVTSGLIIFKFFYVRVSTRYGFKFCKKIKIFICSQWFLFQRCQWVAPNSILNLNCCIPFSQRSLFFVYLFFNISLKLLYFSQLRSNLINLNLSSV